MRSLTFGFAYLLLVLGLTVSGPAMAYIGPGAGITMLGALWGVVVAVVLALGAVLFWPIRALLRRKKQAPAGTVSARDDAAAVAGAREKASS